MTKKRLLLIDDEASFTRILKLNLEETGRFEVRVENDGRLAVAAAKSFHPDLILLDVGHDDVDGGEVASELRKDRDLSRIPIVYLTAIVSPREVEERSGVIGGRLFLAKPVSKQTLLEMIDRVLGE
jgi:CheY-like chemotaxis protein